MPQFHKRVKEWASQNVELGGRFATDATFCPFYWEPGPGSVGEEFIEDVSGLEPLAQRVPVRAGCLFLWDQMLPHGSAPNR